MLLLNNRVPMKWKIIAAHLTGFSKQITMTFSFFGISFFCLTCPIKTALERLKAARTIIALHDIDFQKKFFSVEDRTNYFRYSVEFSKFESISIFSNLECKVRQAGEENTMGERYKRSVLQTWHRKCSSQKKLNNNHIVVVMETLLAPVSFCQKPNVLIFNPLK